MNSSLDSIAYCGIYCKKCYKNKMFKVAKKLKKEIESAVNKGFKKEEYLSDENFDSSLDNLIKLECNNYCRLGGGKKDCIIKNCCKQKNINGCFECAEVNTCNNLKEQFRKNSIKLKKYDVEKYIQLYK
ncbi:MAG: DUF3795 domain-containing protein [archaeon]